MFALTAIFLRLLPRTAGSLQTGTAQHLMESAEARAGLDPRQAGELRSAACAYLRVVR